MAATPPAQTRREDIVDLQCAMIHIFATDSEIPDETARGILPSAAELEDWVGDNAIHPLEVADAETWLDRLAESGLMA